MATKRKKTEKRVTYEVEVFKIYLGVWGSVGLSGFQTAKAARVVIKRSIEPNSYRIVKVTREVVR